MYYDGISMTNYASLGKTDEELEDEEREDIEFDDPTMIPNVQSDEYTSGFFQWVSDNALVNISNGRYKKRLMRSSMKMEHKFICLESL